jgi:hypothetical protein
MGFRYVLVNHTQLLIQDVGLYSVWQVMARLIKECGWSTTDKVEMMSEENSWDEIGKCVKSGYKSDYDIWAFD